MAPETPRSCRNLVLYEVYVRNHGPHGTFADVEADLPRIRSMGVDIVWFMPVHPVGMANRKGRLGSPYAIADYRAVNPEYGTREDFGRLIEAAHAAGLKVMIDVVYNHTSPDSWLAQTHPEWFHSDANGQPAPTEIEWSDVVDLRYDHEELADYLVETLCGWAEFGVDGFRCDVASLVPERFWLRARAAVARVKPDVIWLAESVYAAMVARRRQRGLVAITDSELYSAFDITYDYDIWPIWQAVVAGREPLQRYLTMLRFQDGIYPASFAKLRYVENHDQARITKLAPTRAQALAWTAFAAFNRGPFLIYGGQESAASHTPSLFDEDKVPWGEYELQPFLTTLARLKKDEAQERGEFVLLGADGAAQAAWICPGHGLYGIFNTEGSGGELAVRLPDGEYEELLGGGRLRVSGGRVAMPESAAILRYRGVEVEQAPFYSFLLDFYVPPE